MKLVYTDRMVALMCQPADRREMKSYLEGKVTGCKITEVSDGLCFYTDSPKDYANWLSAEMHNEMDESVVVINHTSHT